MLFLFSLSGRVNGSRFPALMLSKVFLQKYSASMMDNHLPFQKKQKKQPEGCLSLVQIIFKFFAS